MGDVMALATMWAGGDVCSEDAEVMKKVRDALLAAKPKWIAMDYSTVEKMTNHDYSATVDWNGAGLRARLANPDVKWGFPKEGYGLWMDNVALLADAKNTDNAYLFMDFIMDPENAAMLSAFARYANGISGSEAFMPADMTDAPEVKTPAEFASLGQFVTVCTGKALGVSNGNLDRAEQVRTVRGRPSRTTDCLIVRAWPGRSAGGLSAPRPPPKMF